MKFNPFKTGNPFRATLAKSEDQRLGHAKYIFRFLSPPAPMKFKQIKKIEVEGFSEKPSTPIFFNLLIKEKRFEKGRTFWCNFPRQHTCKTKKNSFYLDT